MSPELEAKLRFYGWFPGRRVDDNQLHKWLRMAVEERGCRIFPEAVRVLREFGGLTLPHLYLQFGMNEDPGNGIPLTPAQVHEDHLGWLGIEWDLGEVLFPIGYELGQGFTFAVSSTGKIFYLGISTSYCGESVEDFLEGARGGIIEPTPEYETKWSEVEQLYEAIYKAEL